MPISPIPGVPGIPSAQTMSTGYLSKGGPLGYAPAGGTIDGTKSRDPGNSSYSLFVLRCGLLMGKATSGGKYSPSIFGITTGALAQAGTSITVSAAQATEIVRRIGSTGNITLTGPPAAAGTVRSVTVAYSAVNTTTGVVTITTPSVNAVHTLGFTNTPAGTFKLRFVDLNGVVRSTGPITYSATIGTLISNINTAVDTALGASLVVASGSVVTAVALTYSGAGYLGLPQTLVEVDGDALTAGNVSVTSTTTGVDGRFIAGSFVGDTDGTQTPITAIAAGQGVIIPDDSTDAYFALLPVSGYIDQSVLLPAWPSDTSLRSWIRAALSTASGGKFVFADQF